MKEILDAIVQIAKEQVPDLDERLSAIKENKESLEVKWLNEESGDLNVEDGYDCELCHNKGHRIKLSESGELIAFDCKCQKIRATLKRAKRSGLSDVLKDFTFKKYIATEDWQEDIKLKAQEFCLDEDAKWFYIGGQVGSGKSHICTAIASYYIKAGKEVRYMLWVDESKYLKAHINDDIYQEKIREIKNADVLYIDDFLKVKQGEEPTAADINLAFQIINSRLHDKSKITIISSERMINELLDYDEGTMSRVYVAAGRYRFGIAKDRSKNYRLRDEVQQ